MKRIKFLLVALFVSLAFISCESTTESTYFMKLGNNTSINFGSNIYIETAVHNHLTNSIGQPINFFGEQGEAIAWFDQECNKMSQPSFVEQIPILDETWAEIELCDMANGNTIKTNKVTFPKSYL